MIKLLKKIFGLKGATRYISGSSKYVVKYTAPVKNNAPVIKKKRKL